MIDLENLWDNIPKAGNLIGDDEEIMREFKGQNDARSRALWASASCSNYIRKVQEMGLMEHFILFSLQDDASIMCFMNKDRYYDEFKSPHSENPRIDIKFYPMKTYPILRILLSWEQKNSNNFYSFEATPDITEINVQKFFSNFINSSILWIFINSSEENIPLIEGIEGHFDNSWIRKMYKELKKAIKDYNKIPDYKKNYQIALQNFQQTYPLY